MKKPFLMFFAVTCSFIIFSLPTLATGCNESCSWINADKWGDNLKCQNPSLAFGICGSGENPNCEDGDTPNQLYCCNEPNVSKIDPSKEIKTKNYGERMSCPKGQFVIAFCGSGRNRDCGGFVNTITCASSSQIHLEEESKKWFSTSDFGGQVFCPNAMTMTGACGSGMNKDCPGGTVNEVECKKYKIVD